MASPLSHPIWGTMLRALSQPHSVPKRDADLDSQQWDLVVRVRCGTRIIILSWKKGFPPTLVSNTPMDTS